LGNRDFARFPISEEPLQELAHDRNASIGLRSPHAPAIDMSAAISQSNCWTGCPVRNGDPA
jgi:hypothetical protein